MCLINVQFIGVAGVEAGLDDLQDVVLQFHIVPGQLDLFLRLPHLHVVLGHVAQQGDQHGVVVLHRPFQLGLGAQHLTAVESPEVQLPGQIEAEVPLVAELGKAGEKLRRRRGQAVIATGGVLGLREDFALGDGQRGPGLKDARAVLFQVDVLLVGMDDQIVEHGVIENAPPAAQVGSMAADADVAGFDPARRDCGLGRGVIGSHLEALVHVVRKARASTQAKRHGHKAEYAGLSKGMPHG